MASFPSRSYLKGRCLSHGPILRVFVDHTTRDTEAGETANSLFNLKIELIPDTGVASLQQLPDLDTRVEGNFSNVTCLPGLPHSLDTMLRNKSKLLRVEAPATHALRTNVGSTPRRRRPQQFPQIPRAHGIRSHQLGARRHA